MAALEAKRRILPPWMAATVAEPRKTTSAVRPKRRKKTVVARTTTVYCMNEVELVDVALGILAENCKYKGTEENIPSENEGEQESQQGRMEPQWSPVSSDEVNAPQRGPVPCPKPDVLGSANKTDSEDEEDDALKYVREIFF